MTWVPIRGAVRALRETARLEQRELAKKSGLTERTIRLLESKRAPKTMYAASVKALATVLGCAPEELATWVTRRRPADGQAADGHFEDVAADIDGVLALPQAGTLSRRAQRERELGRDGATVETGAGRLELLGPTLLKRCHAACAAVDGQRFAIGGIVQDYEALPARAAAMLGVPVGHGARFLLARNVARGVPFYATVFTRRLEHTRALVAAGESRARALVVARVVVAQPSEATGDWKGFFIFEKRPKPHPFAFVVDEI